MKEISFFLEKFKSLGLEGALSKQVFIETVEKILSVKLPPSSVELRQETFFVKAHPTLKSELYLKREAILVEFAKTLGSKGERKIR
ncbi:MAG: hypothetical protein UW34_C0005G0008 [Parcubacteria group bacterium GW2011_GWA2_44_15]|nr:MAG: hypothetical protein UW34_C0005G0008 [Parcubacteria group bacterium GW2011_GWA2_44_15]